IILSTLILVLSTALIKVQGTPILEVRVIDTVTESGQQDITIPVYVKNYSDTIAGFSLWLQLYGPDIMTFDIRIDTTNTLLSDWQILLTNHIGGNNHNLRIVGMANDFATPPFIQGTLPQTGSIPFLKIVADVNDILDTTTSRTTDIVINKSIEYFNFSDPYGQLIGTIRDSILDTAYFVCLEWQDDTTCLEWEQVEGPPDPYDMKQIYWDYFSYLDSANVFIYDGSLTVTGGYLCGDINSDGFGPNISDLIYLATYMFNEGPVPEVLMSADCNGIGQIDITDVIYLLNYMFYSGDEPICGQ
ncbi:MAG: hypothetical protein U9R56_05995, partial [candidate division Zixibacteria bacterium]|nr:hypothetical protein [candidate division Zixibacteria bacterium]